MAPVCLIKNICIIHWRQIGAVKRQLSENLAPAIRSAQVQSRAGGTNQRRPKPAAHLAHILPTTSANAKPDGATLLVNSMVSRPCTTGCQPQTGCKSGFQNTPLLAAVGAARVQEYWITPPKCRQRLTSLRNARLGIGWTPFREHEHAL